MARRFNGRFRRRTIIASIVLTLMIAGQFFAAPRRLAPSTGIAPAQPSSAGQASLIEQGPWADDDVAVKATRPAAVRAPRIVKHIIQPGETLWSLAQAYGTDVDSIVVSNNLSRAGSVSVGQELAIYTAKGIIYTVKPGDTLGAVASRYGVSEEDVVTANSLADRHRLAAGQELILPGAKAAPARVQVASVSRGGSRQSYSAAPESAAGSRNSGFIWPSSGAITSGFGPRWGRMHRGIDISGDTGDPVAASRGGTVSYAGWKGSFGKTVILSHSDGSETLYGHLSAISVDPGERVSQGQLIGKVGSTGFSTGPHLHFEIHEDGKAVNPVSYLP